MARRKDSSERQSRMGRQSSEPRSAPSYWSDAVTRKSNALDLEPGLFTGENPTDIARSLLRSAEKSTRRRGTVFQSAMSMLNFYINRAGKNLPEERRRILEEAKEDLRRLHQID